MGCFDRFLASSVDDLKSAKFYKALLGEMIGTMFLVLLACSSIYGETLVQTKNAPVDQTRISLAFGLAVASMVWVLADVSGGHINPAVSAGMFVARKISLVRFILYVVFQCAGGIVGSALQRALTCNWQVIYYKDFSNYTCKLGLTELDDGVTPVQGVFIELLISFVLVIVVFATCDKTRSDLKGSGPLAIGLAVALCHLAFNPLTGVSMNTARSFGPAVVLNKWKHHWVYWVGPILGGAIAGLVYEFIFAGNAATSKISSWVKDSEYDEDRANGEVYELKAGNPASAADA